MPELDAAIAVAMAEHQASIDAYDATWEQHHDAIHALHVAEHTLDYAADRLAALQAAAQKLAALDAARKKTGDTHVV